MESQFVRVADVMRISLHTIDGLASVQCAIGEMKRHNISSLVIERRHEGDEYGLVTVRDIGEKVVLADRPIERTSIYEIMTKPALTISADMNAVYAIRLLVRLSVSRALVTGDQGLLGLVSLRDLLLAYYQPDRSA